MVVKKFSIALLLLLVFDLTAQDFKIPDVEISDLEVVNDPDFPEANAVILHKEIKATVGVQVKVFERIKIINSEGFDFATIDPRYYDLENIRGTTYNLVDGQIVKTKLKREMIFTEKVGEGVKSQKVTFPDVRAGSIIELRYKTDRGSTADIYLQEAIPIKKINVEVYNMTGRIYRIAQNPRAFLKVNRVDERTKVFVSSKNVPALEEEDYVYDLNLYRAKLQLKIIGYHRSRKFTKWEDILDALYDDDDFAFQVKPKGLYKNALQEVLGTETDQLKQVELVYNYLKDSIQWNEYIGIFPTNGTRETFNKKKGNSADINMMFVSMLRSLGYEAYPVLASTKSNGAHLAASIEAFNYCLAGVKIFGENRVFDAANTKATFHYLPKHLLNWQGMLIRENGTFDWIDLTRPKISQKKILVNASLDKDFLLAGTVKEERTGYYAMDFQRLYKDAKRDTANVVSYDYRDLEIDQFKIDEIRSNEKSTFSYQIKLEEAMEAIGEDYYMNPLLFLSNQKNPFTAEYRRFPVDFSFPYKNQYIVTVDIPDDYEVTQVPEGVRISLPENLGSLTYRVSVQGNKIQAIIDQRLNSSVIPTTYYYELKEYYRILVEKESQQIVFKKNEP